jgi:carnitine O-acetyltransferase
VHFDSTGKVSLDHIYTQPDPRPYFNTLRELDYRIPGLAKPYFMKLIRHLREAMGIRNPKVLDIGCSYGINAALLKCDTTMEELYKHYGDDGHSDTRTRDKLLASDRNLTRSRNGLGPTRFVGLDSSQPALSYALSAEFLDGAVHANLEMRDATEREREQFTGTDLVISTGCIGYVGERTISQVVNAQAEREPWMAHFVLRMFSFEPIAESLAGVGYETVHIDRVFKQRRFASAEEQAQVFDTMSTAGVDPQGLETDGWLYAQLYVSRPRGANSRAVLDLAPDNKSQIVAIPTQPRVENGYEQRRRMVYPNVRQ